MTDAQFSRAVSARLDEQQVVPEWTFIDPSATSFSTQLWTDRHPVVALANNEVLNGIRSVSTALGSGLLRVHHSCRGLLDELPGYAWPEEATARGEDKPIKCHDHSCDGLRYVIHSTAHVWRQVSDALKDSG
ncbi:hypothetical protein [Streptomyces sp. NPDC056921]|uniref:hypothetical protein n=1 Tax=Streptomyces sp. NPDC056921 TaxID=3345966 RepID=UPI003639D918